MAVFAVAVLMAAHSRAAIQSQPFYEVRFSLDGAPSGDVLSWEGGDVRATAVVESGGSAAGARKRPSAATPAPLSLELRMPLTAPVVAWVQDFLNGVTAPRALVLSETSARPTQPSGGFSIAQARLREVRFSELEAGFAKGAPRVTLVIDGTTAAASAVVVPPATALGKANINAFKLTVPGLDTSQISRVGPITFRRSSGSANVESSSLTLTLASGKSDIWRAWLQDFVVAGNNGDNSERTASLEFLSVASTLHALNLAQVGILRVSRLKPDDASQPPRDEAELYFERASLAGAAVTTPAPPPPPAPPPSSTPPPAPPPPPAETKPVAKSEGPAESPNGNPNDEGWRDPAEFPRLSDLVRLSFQSRADRNSTGEDATYSAKEDVARLHGRLMEATKRAGWETTSQKESGDKKNGRYVNLTFTKGKTQAQVQITDAKVAPESRMDVRVNIPKQQ